MNYFEKCELLNNNPVLLARHFHHRAETFFQINLINTIKHQWKGYILCNKNRISGAWLTTCSQILNPPKLSEETLGTYIEFIDNTIHANLPAPDDDPVLYELVN